MPYRITLSDRLFFFFFQAEDGIRDLTVTGVQTCALPIYSLIVSGRRENQWSGHMRHYVSFNRFLLVGAALLFVTPFELPSRWLPPPIQQEIGRASCRERV